MELLLKRDVPHVGIVGDVVHVKPGYARNYLLPQDIATQATEANIRGLAEERLKAEERRRLAHDALVQAAERLRDIEVTITAAANDEGVLYGSVGAREVAAALRDEGHTIDASNIDLHEPIRRLDNITVVVRFGDDITTEVKVWVVRSQATPEHAEDAEEGDDQT